MKHIITILTSAILGFTTCKAQTVQTIRDVQKMQENKKNFVGKPFKDLLYTIKPEIKYAYGTPENKGESIVGTNIKFFLVERARLLKEKEIKRTGVLVGFVIDSNNTHKPLPKGNVLITKEDLLKEYGDMIVQSIYVSGKD